MQELHFKNRKEWRLWLSRNHSTENGIWMIFYKKATGKPTIDYEEAVEEALCFGWIDSTVKSVDEEKYLRKFTPRNNKSVWSALNKKRIGKVIREGRMTEAGLAKISTAKENGYWDKPDRPIPALTISPEFSEALKQNPRAKENFEKLAPSYRKQYNGWINTAKQPETRQKRIHESISLLEKGEKLGLK
jgi:uncharacterized protein YdeI (YjbR/CyaY-like superfamily)